MSVFFCDSNCELWFTKVDELGIKVIGMPYNIDDEERDYDMGRETDFDDFYTRVKNGSMPKTSALNTQNYIDYFEPVLASGEDIIYVHFSSNLSATFNFMNSAIEELKQKYPERTIKTVDTYSISMPAGLIVYEAAKLWKAGASDDEIIKWVEDNRQKFTAYFMVEDLNHLKRGGRLSGAAALFGTLLGIKPILKINSEGRIVKEATAKGNRKSIAFLVDKMKEIGANVADYPIVIIDANSSDNAKLLKEEILKAIPDADVWYQPIGPTIGTHCGPGTVGIVFHSKQR